MRAAFYTLGCKVNQNETGALEQMFRQAGFEIVGKDQPADVYVVNSCTVTAGGDAKSRQWLRRAKRNTPGAVAVLTGCFPQAFPQKALLPEADIVTGTAQRAKLIENVLEFLRNRSPIVDIRPHAPQEAFEELPAGRLSGRTRAFIKIEDGCNRRCAYCIVPSARGPVRSRPIESIIREAKALAANGCAEAVLAGVNLPSYGRECGGDLAEVVEQLARVEGIRRIRLSSLDPDLVTPEQTARFAAVEKLCPHFHLSLQSGCDATLRRMRRPYTTQQYRAAARALAAALPGASFTTDVIVGFPGETEQDFEESLRFVEEMEFLKVHVFPFSPRPGTPAAGFDGQLGREEKSKRVHTMQKAADKTRKQWIEAQNGSEEQVLLETPKKGLFTGYTRTYIPTLVFVPDGKAGDVASVRLGIFDGEWCHCTTI